MGCGQSLTCSTLHHFAISFLILMIVTLTQLGFNAEGRPIVKPIGYSKIGSRPPQCDRRCSSCGHCEAIQVPTTPQDQGRIKNSPTISRFAYARGDGYSNYKPMSWKCKCGNLIFNP